MSFFTTSAIIGAKIWIQYKFNVHSEGAYGNEHINMDFFSRLCKTHLYIYKKNKNMLLNAFHFKGKEDSC